MNSREDTLTHAHLRAMKLRMGQPHSELPAVSALTALMKHGGLHTLLDQDLMTARLTPFLATDCTTPSSSTIQDIQNRADYFFHRLCLAPAYQIDSSLMSYIAFPQGGVAYDPAQTANPAIPAVFTFVGQFIDHDLTMNALNLFVDQMGVVMDGASPLIDLDSVYGPRMLSEEDAKHVFDGPNFRLKKLGKNAYDLPRKDGKAYIFDSRNDENQLLLQIHILLMRVHNKIVQEMGASGSNPIEARHKARKQVVANWQSVVLHDYMPKIIDSSTLSHVLSEIEKPDYGDLKHKPLLDLATGVKIVRMPHEFAIGFRFGHSQLREMYQLNSGPPVLLFNNRRVDGADDLQGSRDLSHSHVIDWEVFYPAAPSDVHQSLKIDGKVTPAVFDLPESAIPDDIKYIGNLPRRNLIRSRLIGVASGEEVADFFRIPRVAENVIAPDAQAHALFTQDCGIFKTPLWYYILKEAEADHDGQMLGKLGGRIVAEVLAGGLYYGGEFPFQRHWRSTITGQNKVLLRDLIGYVRET